MMATRISMPKLIWKRMEQLDLFKEEEKEEVPPTWGEIVRDPESMFILFSLIAVVALMIFW